MKKKVSMILAMILAVAAVMTGCAQPALDGSQVVTTMDGAVDVELGEINVLLRYQEADVQANYGELNLYGNHIYRQTMGNGRIYGEVARDSLMEDFQEMCVLEAEAENFGVELTQEEKDAIAKTAADFWKDNTKRVKKAMGITQEQVERTLTLLTIKQKMYNLFTADVDTAVTEEEAAQKRIKYIYVSIQGDRYDENDLLIPLTEEEKQEKWDNLQATIDEAKETGDFDAAAEAHGLYVKEVTFGEGFSLVEDVVHEEAAKLEDGEYSDVVASDIAYYAIQMIDSFDEVATEEQKLNIIQGRMDDKFEEEYEKLAPGYTFTVEEGVLEQLHFERAYIKRESK